MPEEKQHQYYELYTMCWKLLRRGLTEMTTTPDLVKLAQDLRTEGQALYERYRDLCPDAVFKIIDNTLLMFYRAYDDLPRPEREPEQMNIFDLGKETKG